MATATPDQDLNQALLDARSTSEILLAKVRIAYRRRNPRQDYTGEEPTETKLLLRLSKCPETVQVDLRKAVAKLLVEGESLDKRAGWTALGDPTERAKAHAEGREMLHEAIRAEELPQHFDPEKFLANTLPKISRLVFAVDRFLPSSPIGRMPGGRGIWKSGVLELPEICRRRLDLPEKDRPPDPIELLVVALWLDWPAEVPANTRTDRARTLPAQLAMFDAPASDSRERLFSAPSRGNGQLPLFETDFHGGEYITPSLPLALYDLGVSHQSPGPGAPLALRLFVEAILASPMDGRQLGRPIALDEISVRFMLSRLYPNRTPRPNEWRPLVEDARVALASMDAAISWDDGVRRSAVLITSFPEHLDDPVRIIVDLPPGAGHGPQVSNRLHHYGPCKGRHYRALLNLAYWWHEPGRTLIPSGRGSHWLRVRTSSRYRKLTDAELVNLVFPTSTRGEVRKLVHEAAKVLDQLREDGELRIVDDKPLPPLAGDE